MLFLVILAALLGQISAANQRIIGGKFAAPGQFPYQVSIQINGKHNCGGSIISDKYIVTAAHCMYGIPPSSMKVVVGTVDLLKGDGRSYGIKKVVIHAKYIPQITRFDYDIALIQINCTMSLGKGTVDKIELADKDLIYPASTVGTISGFGAVNAQVELPNKLKYAFIPIWSKERCNSLVIPGLTERMICASHPTGQVSACQGDSGGPLMVANKLYGLVSWGFGCGANAPTMYTHLPSLRSWIKQNSGV